MHAYKTGTDGATPQTPDGPRWSIVIPAYNEEDYLPATLASLIDQTVSDAVLILVDNNSTDQTRALMEKAAAERPDRSIRILSDDRPGRIQALETGIAATETELVALCDADTFYPRDYLARAEKLFDRGNDVMGAFAFGVYSDAGPFAAWFARNKGAFVAWLLRNQGHTGGYGQCFRMQQELTRFGLLAPLSEYGSRVSGAFAQEIFSRGGVLVHEERYQQEPELMLEPAKRLARYSEQIVPLELRHEFEGDRTATEPSPEGGAGYTEGYQAVLMKAAALIVFLKRLTKMLPDLVGQLLGRFRLRRGRPK